MVLSVPSFCLLLNNLNSLLTYQCVKSRAFRILFSSMLQKQVVSLYFLLMEAFVSLTLQKYLDPYQSVGVTLMWAS